MILIASWNRHQDMSMELPSSVKWEDGSPATLEDYREHELDTHTFVDEFPDHVEKHMFPNVVAEVVYDSAAGSWVISGRGVRPQSLDLPDPQAKDEEIYSELYTFPIVYKAIIKR